MIKMIFGKVEDTIDTIELVPDNPDTPEDETVTVGDVKKAAIKAKSILKAFVKK